MKNKSSIIKGFLRETYVFTLAGLLIFGFLLPSCSGGGGSSNLVNIPQDASFVMNIDFKSLSDKSKDFKSIFNRDFLESMEMSTSEMLEMQEAYENIVNSGVDYKQKSFIFAKISQNKDENYFAATFMLEDPAKFEAALKKSKEKFDIKTEGGLKYFAKDGVILGWRKKTALLYGIDNKKAEVAKLKESFEKIFKTSDAESLKAKNAEFKESLASAKDFTMWMDAQKIMNMAQEDMDEMAKESPFMAEMVKSTSSYTFEISFEKGEIVMESITHLDKSKSAKYESLLKSGIQNKLMKSLPIKVPSMMMGFAIGMKPLYEMSKDDKWMKDLDESVKTMKMTAKEVFDMLDGEIILLTKDLKTSTLIQDPQPEFALAIGINDKKLMDKMLSAFSNQGLIEKKGDFYEAKGLPRPIFLIEKNKALYLTMTESYKNDIIKGNGQLESKYTKLSADNSFVFFMGIKELLSQWPEEYMTPDIQSFKDNVLPELESMESYSTTVKNHKARGKAVLKFTNKSKNSLLILTEIIEKTSKKEKAVSMN